MLKTVNFTTTVLKSEEKVHSGGRAACRPRGEEAQPVLTGLGGAWGARCSPRGGVHPASPPGSPEGQTATRGDGDVGRPCARGRAPPATTGFPPTSSSTVTTDPPTPASPAAPAFLPPPRREPRAHGAHLGYALSSHALQNSLRAAECRKTPRPPKVGRRPSSTTSSHSPRCQNCPRERGRCGWSREAPAPGLPPSNQSKHPPPPQGRQAWAPDGATWARCWASDPPPTSAQCPPNSQGKRDLATVDTCDPNPPPPVGTRLWGLSGLSRAPPPPPCSPCSAGGRWCL